MGSTHYRSNLRGKDGTERIGAWAAATIGNVEATNLKINTAATIPTINTNSLTATIMAVAAANYIKLGAHQYILFGALDTEATIVSTATAIDSSVKGSVYMSTAGKLWVYDGDDTATRVTLY